MPTPFFEPRNKRTGKYPTPCKKVSSIKTIQTTLSNIGIVPEPNKSEKSWVLNEKVVFVV